MIHGIVQLTYIVATALFVFALHWMNTPATAVPATPAYTPFRAVAGVFIQCSAKMNSADAARYPSWLTPYITSGYSACRRS